MLKKLSMLFALAAICASGLVAGNGDMPKTEKVSRINKKHRDVEYKNKSGNEVHEYAGSTSSSGRSCSTGSCGTSSCGTKHCGRSSCNRCVVNEEPMPEELECYKTIPVKAECHKQVYTTYTRSCPDGSFQS